MFLEKEVGHIKPFNSLFYKSCYYNSFFPVIEMLGKNVEVYIMNDVPNYQLISGSNNRLYISMDYISKASFESLLQSTGVQLNRLDVDQTNFKERLIECLDQGRPVIVWIDYFYSPLRSDQFRKNHGPHSVLVYGYDLADEVFIILEHEQRMILDYKRKKIRFKDLSNCYFSYVERFAHLNGDSRIESFSDVKSIIFSRDEMVDCVRGNYDYYASELIEGIKGLETLSEYLAMNLFDKEFFVEYVDLQSEGLNQIINTKKARIYLFSNLVQQPSPHVEICNHWTSIRTILLKSIYSGKFSENIVVEVIERLDSIAELERVHLREWCNNKI